MLPSSSKSLVDEFAQDVLVGLWRAPKFIPPKYFYDAVGSELFEQITEQPEYYPTRTEAAMLRELAPKLAGILGDDVSLVELGSGSSAKTTILLESFLAHQDALHYLPIDISKTMLHETAERLDERYPALDITPIAGQYESGLKRASTLVAETDDTPDRMLVLFLGSSIGNMEIDDALRFLSGLRTHLERNDAFLIGFDLKKDPEVLNNAYNDAAGVTAKFNLNILTRINNELGGEFDVSAFSHFAFFNENASRIEMHLRSERDQDVHVKACDQSFHFDEGETIHTENSYKYTRELIGDIASAAGFRVREIFTDPNDWFALALYEPA